MNVSDLKNRVDGLSDDELKALIVGIAGASGIDQSKIKKLTDDIPKTRRTISALSEKQIAKLAPELKNGGFGELISRLGID